MAGGLSHRETLWVEDPDVSPVWRKITNKAWDQLLAAGAPSGVSLPRTLDRGTYLVGKETVRDHAKKTISTGKEVYLGPCGSVLQGTPLWSSMRLVSLGHDLTPHGPAQSLACTGLPDGRGRQAGTGTVIKRLHGSNAMTSFAITVAAGTSGPAFLSQLRVGEHSHQNRPLVVPLASPTFLQNLNRSRTTAQDRLSQYYKDEYVQALTFNGTADRARSRSFDAYAASLSDTLNAATLQKALQKASFTYPTNQGVWSTYATQSVRIAATLLQDSRCMHASVTDYGANANYDSHFPNPKTFEQHALDCTSNVISLLWTLVDLVAKKILDLKNTLIVVHSEFGRIRDVAKQIGTNHWSRGYAALLFGGGLTDRKVLGSMAFDASELPKDAYGGRAAGGFDTNTGFVPADLRAAILYAAGVLPFHHSVFQVDETSLKNIPGITSIGDAETLLVSRFFGP